MADKFDKHYRVKLHIKFTHDDGRTESVHDMRFYNMENIDSSLVEDMVNHQFENSDTPLTEYPDGWYGNLKGYTNEELVIDEITYMGKQPEASLGRTREVLTSIEKEMVDLESYLVGRDIEYSVARHPTGWNINIPLPDTNKDD